jgi:Na+-translocating ferredoxin:NAD+ oxidoreductase RnfG subunit
MKLLFILFWGISSLIAGSQSGKEIDFRPGLLLKELKELHCPENLYFQEIVLPDSIIKTQEVNGKFFRVISNEKLIYTAYIGRVNSCRTGGCSFPKADHKGSEYEFFDYFILFDHNGKVVSVRVFNYQATHGQEITIKGWLKQFSGYDGTKNLRVGKEIDAISGATISVYGIVEDIRRKTMLLTYVRFHF